MDDLTPLFADPCWMFVHLAREADVGVIMRRGPTNWWRLTLWDTRRDRFEKGQWFRGRVYPERCDVSPDGKLFVYFAGKFKYPETGGYGDTWTAVSRPPNFTALALWTVGGTWGGGGIFKDNRTLTIGYGNAHPNHPPGPLRVVDSWPGATRSWMTGWTAVAAPCNKHMPEAFRKTLGSWTLERRAQERYPWRKPSLYTLYRNADQPVALFEAQWSDFDQRGRLVATAGGRVLGAKLRKKNDLDWRELAAFHEERPERMEAPAWAQRW